MNADEIEIVLRLLTGHWPNPPLGDDEAIVWTRTLRPCGFDEACDVVDSLAATGRAFRPPDGEFTSAYRHLVSRRPAPEPHPEIEGERGPCGHSPSAVACRATVERWMPVIRRQLAQASGPLAASLRPPTQPERTDP